MELGAEFVHGRPPELFAALEAGGLASTQVMGDHMCSRSGSIVPCKEWMDRVTAVLESMKTHAGEDRSFESFLQASDCDEETRAGARSFVEGFNAADRRRVSVQSLVRQQQAEDSIDGEKAFRVASGYDAVPRYLLGSSSTALRLNTLVHGIEWKRGKVALAVKNRAGIDLEPVVAKKAVITVPLGVLQGGPIIFQPDVAGLRDTVKRLAMGHVVRLVLRFREPFWESRPEFSNMSFLHSHDEWFPTWWTQLPVKAPILTGWTGGPNADRFAGRDESFIVERAVETLSRLFRMDFKTIAGLVDAWYTHNWQADPFSLGAYSYVPVGALSAVVKLAQPVEDTLYFAGEATDTEGHWGTVHGAIATGVRAVKQILASR